MATLKDISMRLKSVKNIQKITASMKMVSAAKFARAERELRPAKAYGAGAQEIGDSEKSVSGHLLIAITSDRGLCGAAHTNIVKAIRECLKAAPQSEDVRLVLVGDKARSMLARQYSDKLLFTFNEVGRKPPSFDDASIISQAIMSTDFKFDKASMYYNVFNAPKLSIYDEIDEEALRCYNEFLLTSLIYYAMKEASCSEQSARMTAMDSATKNAGEMIDSLTLAFNRTRQAAITKELTEIISGAAAV